MSRALSWPWPGLWEFPPKPLSLTLCSSSPPRRSVCDSICDEIRGLGGEAVGVPGDLTKPGVIQELVDAAIREFSGIDILVNNA